MDWTFWLSLGVSVAAMITSLGALFYARASSPYYYAGPEKIQYGTTFSVAMDRTGANYGSYTVMLLAWSKTPARDVRVSLTVERDDVEVIADPDVVVSTQPAGEGTRVLVTFPQLAAKSISEFKVRWDVTEEARSALSDEETWRSFVDSNSGLLSEFDVTTERGTVRGEHLPAEYLLENHAGRS